LISAPTSRRRIFAQSGSLTDANSCGDTKCPEEHFRQQAWRSELHGLSRLRFRDSASTQAAVPVEGTYPAGWQNPIRICGGSANRLLLRYVLYTMRQPGSTIENGWPLDALRHGCNIGIPQAVRGSHLLPPCHEGSKCPSPINRGPDGLACSRSLSVSSSGYMPYTIMGHEAG
jgi:hypothetical protein